ncbi:hypothetical protein IMZ48_41390 [Candidatus Bathyarchaeota archaeon]|nr:hypothetical protein [Candidatus Bathyarchaeota archaeon]
MPGPAVGPEKRRDAPARGRPRCPSLVELAMEAVIANMDMCVMANREMWSRLPQRILLDIYEQLSVQNR